MKKFAIILSGCGVSDGTEIHECVTLMLAIDKAGASYSMFAPDIKQRDTVNHVAGKTVSQERNVLEESARIARGNIKPIEQLDVRNFDAIVFPGGFGVAKNLSDFAINPDNITVIPSVEKVIKQAVSLKKPIGAMCIAPILLSRVIKNSNVTIGNDEGTISKIENMQSKHTVAKLGEVVVDENYKLFTTPCYMYGDARISQVAASAEKLVKDILEVL